MPLEGGLLRQRASVHASQRPKVSFFRSLQRKRDFRGTFGVSTASSMQQSARVARLMQRVSQRPNELHTAACAETHPVFSRPAAIIVWLSSEQAKRYETRRAMSFRTRASSATAIGPANLPPPSAGSGTRDVQPITVPRSMTRPWASPSTVLRWRCKSTRRATPPRSPYQRPGSSSHPRSFVHAPMHQNRALISKLAQCLLLLLVRIRSQKQERETPCFLISSALFVTDVASQP